MVFCLMAALRVLLYSAAFPFFTNVDEPHHFDLVVRYSRGDIPRKIGPISMEARRYMALYGSPEYFQGPQQYANHKYPAPLWTKPDEAKAALATLASDYAIPNTESSQAPLYYAIAGVWLMGERLCGLTGGSLLYGIRFMNVFVAAGLVWLGYAAAKQTFPDEPFLRLGVPALLAIFPQDAFYSIQNDVLSPVCFGLAFIALVKWLRSDRPSVRLGVLTGLALAAVGLVKISNLPLLLVGIITVAAGAWRQARAGTLRSSWRSLALLILCAALPMACWFAWNLQNFGDLTGSATKIQRLGWTYKPVSEWWHHPILTPGGFFYFWSQLMARFWRGEFVWGLEPLASPAVDAFYWVSSLVLSVMAAISLFPRATPVNTFVNQEQRQVVILALCSFFGCVVYLALLSMVFDFGECAYPSRALPYFTSGRLLLGALIPFLIIYLQGMNWALQRLKFGWLRWWLLAAMGIMIAGSQIDIDQVAFSSAYNWFHLA